MLLASLASDSSWFLDSNYKGGDYGLSLPHPDAGIWLCQETFLPNRVGHMAHQPERYGWGHLVVKGVRNSILLSNRQSAWR